MTDEIIAGAGEETAPDTTVGEGTAGNQAAVEQAGTEDVAPQDETAAVEQRSKSRPPDFEAQAAIDPVADLRQTMQNLFADMNLPVEKLESDTAAYHAALESAGIVRPFATPTVDAPKPQPDFTIDQ